MDRDELLFDCKVILMRTQNKKLQDYFYSRPENGDIVIDPVTKADINSFSERMLNRLIKYIEK